MLTFIFSASDTPTTLVVRHVPLPLTCGVFDGTIITDPSLLEEELLTTHVTVVSTAEGKVRDVTQTICFARPCVTGLRQQDVTVFLVPFRHPWRLLCPRDTAAVIYACVRVCDLAGMRSSQTWGKLRVWKAAERMPATLPATCRGTCPNPQGSCGSAAKRRCSLTA